MGRKPDAQEVKFKKGHSQVPAEEGTIKKLKQEYPTQLILENELVQQEGKER